VQGVPGVAEIAIITEGFFTRIYYTCNAVKIFGKDPNDPKEKDIPPQESEVGR
jgi:hypothetical protein